MKYEERKCCVCGKVFVPVRINQRSCPDPECKHEMKLRQQKDWYRKNYLEAREGRRDYMRRRRSGKVEKVSCPKPDTIVAIGYAERQMAESLKLAGKVRTEL